MPPWRRRPNGKKSSTRVFDAHFLGAVVAGPRVAEPDRRYARAGRRRGLSSLIRRRQRGRSGRDSSSKRCPCVAFRSAEKPQPLRRFSRAAPGRLPLRRGFGRPPRGRPDLRRALKEAMRNDGEIFRLPASFACRGRRILLLIDVSGSMKARTDPHLRFAHALVRGARIEVFTIGTRLTRVTRALRLGQPRAGASHRFSPLSPTGTAARASATHCRPSSPYRALPATHVAPVVLILSDGLERGDPKAHDRSPSSALAARAWHLAWMTPLAAADPGYRPETAGAARDPAAARQRRQWRDDGAAVPARSRSLTTEGHQMTKPDVRHASMRIITSGGSRTCPGCSGRCCRASSGPTSRSAATTPIAEYLADVAGRRRHAIGLRAGELGAGAVPR